MLNSQTRETKSEGTSSGFGKYSARAGWAPASVSDRCFKFLRRFDYTAPAPQFYPAQSPFAIGFVGVLEYYWSNLICLMPASIR